MKTDMKTDWMILAHALQNAISHKGKASHAAVRKKMGHQIDVVEIDELKFLLPSTSVDAERDAKQRQRFHDADEAVKGGG